MARQHLVTVWDPAFGTDVMLVHLQVLLDAAEKCHKGEHDPYVWWAKLHSPHRPEPLPHLAEVLQVGAAAKEGEADEETHLYLTDYRSLYVADVGEVTEDDPRKEDTEAAFVPSYYKESGREADCWFRLWDIRRLVADDTVTVVEALRKLRNTRYYGNPVSIYGGMLQLPLIVTETEPEQYFTSRHRLTGAGTPREPVRR